MTFELNCGWDFRFENTAKRLTGRNVARAVVSSLPLFYPSEGWGKQESRHAMFLEVSKF
jgi:hypothetical protein